MMFENNIELILPDALKKEVLRIINDNVSGSSIVEQDTILFLERVLSHHLNLSKKSFLSILLSILQVHTSMVSLLNFSNDLFKFLIKEQEDLKEKIDEDPVLHFLRDYQNKSKKSDEQIKKETLDHLLRYSKIATFSSSGTVKNCLKYLADHNTEVNITCAESRPKQEGFNQAIALANMNVHTTLMTDASLFSNIQDFDCIVVGADAIGKNGIVNKIGTYPIATLATLLKIPIYCLSKTNKILPYDYTLATELEKPSTDLLENKHPKLKISNYYFDTTPIELFTAIITEKGVISREILTTLMHTKKIHPKMKKSIDKTW